MIPFHYHFFAVLHNRVNIKKHLKACPACEPVTLKCKVLDLPNWRDKLPPTLIGQGKSSAEESTPGNHRRKAVVAVHIHHAQTQLRSLPALCLKAQSSLISMDEEAEIHVHGHMEGRAGGGKGHNSPVLSPNHIINFAATWRISVGQASLLILCLLRLWKVEVLIQCSKCLRSFPCSATFNSLVGKQKMAVAFSLPNTRALNRDGKQNKREHCRVSVSEGCWTDD